MAILGSTFCRVCSIDRLSWREKHGSRKIDYRQVKYAEGLMTIIGNRARNFSLWMLKHSEKKTDSITKIKAEKLFGLKEDQFILCRNCSNGITAPDKIITVNDRHWHTFSNPAGFTYEIGCFSSAEGCIVHGEPTSDNTWFAGFSWNYALCSNCLSHLGWFYQHKNAYFFGLILDLLVDTTTTQ